MPVSPISRRPRLVVGQNYPLKDLLEPDCSFGHRKGNLALWEYVSDGKNFLWGPNNRAIMGKPMSLAGRIEPWHRVDTQEYIFFGWVSCKTGKPLPGPNTRVEPTALARASAAFVSALDWKDPEGLKGANQ